MKSSKAQIQAKYHKIPVIRFKDQKLTSNWRQIRLCLKGALKFEYLVRKPNISQLLIN